jgi:hypothetical protein
MAFMLQRDFSGGWNPGADSVNGPKNCLLRMDNCWLDENGIVSIRQGSSKINSSALSNLNVRALYTAYISGTRYRMAQAGDTVYADSTAIDPSAWSASLDTQFCSYLGQIFFASSTRKKKYNGTLRNWGIAAPGTKPSAVATSPASTVLSSCASAEADGAMTSNEGTQSFQNDRAAVANAAVQIIADATTFRGTSTRTIGTPLDFSTYSDVDTVEMYVKVDEPEKLESVTLLIDFNDGSFQTDWAEYTWAADQFLPTLNHWNYISINRGSMTEVHNTIGKGWGTVKAVRVTFTGVGQATLTFDQILIKGGSGAPIHGDEVYYKYIYVRSDGTYVAKSGPSPVGDTDAFASNGATVTCTNPTDTQVTDIWLYRLGGTLDQYYRVATKTVTAYTGTVAITDATSDEQALTLNLPLEEDNTTPPDNIVSLSEDYYTRIFALTSDGLLHPSRRLNPDSFATGQAIRVAGASETPYWVRKAFGGLYVGTSKDIYRVEGTGDELPDGTVDFRVRPLNINTAPLNSAVATDGNVIVYMAQDGPRLFSGEVSTPLRGDTDLLWRGYTRHGVSPVAVATPTARFSMAITDGILSCIIPEGQLAESSQILYRYNLAQQKWYRHLYPQELLTLYREPDGTLISGDKAGFVRQMDTGSSDDGTGMELTIWTIHSDDNKPLTRKRPQRIRVRLDTGGTAAGVGVYLDGSSTIAANVNASSSGIGYTDNTLTTLSAAFLIGVRITGTFTTFKLYEYEVEYLENPALMWGRTSATNMGNVNSKVMSGVQLRACTLGAARTFSVIIDNTTASSFSLTSNTNDPISYTHQFSSKKTGKEIALSADGNVELYDWQPHVLYTLPPEHRIWDSGPIDFGSSNFIWIRSLRIKGVIPTGTTISVYFGEALSTTATISASNLLNIYEVPLGREVRGRQPSLRIDAGSGNTVNLYWVEITFRASGGETQKKTIRVSG